MWHYRLLLKLMQYWKVQVFGIGCVVQEYSQQRAPERLRCSSLRMDDCSVLQAWTFFYRVFHLKWVDYFMVYFCFVYFKLPWACRLVSAALLVSACRPASAETSSSSSFLLPHITNNPTVSHSNKEYTQKYTVHINHIYSLFPQPSSAGAFPVYGPVKPPVGYGQPAVSNNPFMVSFMLRLCMKSVWVFCWWSFPVLKVFFLCICIALATPTVRLRQCR